MNTHDLAERLRTLADADLESARGHTRTAKAAAKAAAEAYRLAADMIEDLPTLEQWDQITQPPCPTCGTPTPPGQHCSLCQP